MLQQSTSRTRRSLSLPPRRRGNGDLQPSSSSRGDESLLVRRSAGRTGLANPTDTGVLGSLPVEIEAATEQLSADRRTDDEQTAVAVGAALTAPQAPAEGMADERRAMLAIKELVTDSAAQSSPLSDPLPGSAPHSHFAMLTKACNKLFPGTNFYPHAWQAISSTSILPHCGTRIVFAVLPADAPPPAEAACMVSSHISISNTSVLLVTPETSGCILHISGVECAAHAVSRAQAVLPSAPRHGWSAAGKQEQLQQTQLTDLPSAMTVVFLEGGDVEQLLAVLDEEVGSADAASSDMANILQLVSKWVQVLEGFIEAGICTPAQSAGALRVADTFAAVAMQMTLQPVVTRQGIPALALAGAAFVTSAVAGLTQGADKTALLASLAGVDSPAAAWYWFTVNAAPHAANCRMSWSLDSLMSEQLQLWIVDLARSALHVSLDLDIAVPRVSSCCADNVTFWERFASKEDYLLAAIPASHKRSSSGRDQPFEWSEPLDMLVRQAAAVTSAGLKVLLSVSETLHRRTRVSLLVIAGSDKLQDSGTMLRLLAAMTQHTVGYMFLDVTSWHRELLEPCRYCEPFLTPGMWDQLARLLQSGIAARTSGQRPQLLAYCRSPPLY